MLSKAKRIVFANPKGSRRKTISYPIIAGYMIKSSHKVLASDQVVMPLKQPKTGGSSNW